jgi:hypothetical protein
VTKDEFYERQVLSSFFPLIFDNGTQWTSFTGQCNQCGKDILDADLRGMVTRPFARVFIVDAFGFCPSCELLTPYRYRLHADMGLTGISPKTGEWSRWEPKRPWAWLRKLFS